MCNIIGKNSINDNEEFCEKPPRTNGILCYKNIKKNFKKMYNKKISDHNNIIRLILVEIRVI